VLVFDRQYSPFIFQYEGQTIVPAESVYAVFEAKQSANAEQVRYAQDKVASVRRVDRAADIQLIGTIERTGEEACNRRDVVVYPNKSLRPPSGRAALKPTAPPSLSATSAPRAE